jgi:hypothetical protein
MKIAIEVTGTSPLLMHNPRMVDKEFEITREIAAITGKRKKTDEDHKAIERLEWYGGLYEQNGVVVQPASKLRKCLIETGRMSKIGKAVERSLSFSALYVPLKHDGPASIDAVFADKRFHSRLSVGVGTKRVMRVRPQFLPWAMTMEGLFIEDAGLNFDELERLVEMAGVVTGIGDNRVNGYGRFSAKIRVAK